MAKHESLDAHEKPPTSVKNVYKYYHQLPTNVIESDPRILDLGRGSKPAVGDKIMEFGKIYKTMIATSCCILAEESSLYTDIFTQDVVVYEVKDIPGLRLIPCLIPEKSQKDLLSKLLHRDLADPQHKTNVHLHHQLPYGAILGEGPVLSKLSYGSFKFSFFDMSPQSSDLFLPNDSEAHKPFSVSRFLERKLRWMTLGGQYDWTKKCYPLENPPFPADLAAFTQCLFPEMKAEAAIVNVYTPGDTLSMHRDVSEDNDNGLVSISLGCDGIFVLGIGSDVNKDPRSVVVRLRSGDAIVMSGSARFAWHGIPRILPDTCPLWLRSWPAEDNSEVVSDVSNTRYESWRGWMSNKRINLNIRQMKD